MKIYTKILITMLPLVFIFLIGTVGISYFFSRSALTDLAEEWLSTRSSEALKITEKYENILHKYGLEKIPASMIKAKLDTIKELSAIKIGEKGYIFAVDTKGIILFHPHKYLTGKDVSHENWFHLLRKKRDRLFFTLENDKNFAISNFFPEWNWFILVVDPEKEVYGLADRMKPYLISLGVAAAIIISLALMLLTRHVMKPLQSLVKGAKQIGDGELDTQISIRTRDELADLAREFNRMAANLKKGRAALKKSHEELENRVKERTRELLLLNQTLSQEIQIRKIKETELKKANHVKDEFLANISHEIRTPLNSVIGFSELLLTMTREKEEISYLHAILLSGNNLLSLINDILDLSKMEARKLELNEVSVDIKRILDDIYPLFKSNIEKKSIQFIKHMDDDIPSSLLMDDTRFQQILVNLIGNAVKFTNKGHVKVTLEKTKSHQNTNRIDLAVTIEDTGIGIPEDKLANIFDSFQQVSSNISREYGGTGLGLSICRHLAALMGGRIQVESMLGKGSIFKLILPEIEVGQTISGVPKKLANPVTADLEPENQKDLIFIMTLKQYSSENPALKSQINSHIFQLIPELKEGVRIKEVQAVIKNIISIADKFHLPELTEFGQDLSADVQSFDIENLGLRLQKLYNILNAIL